MSYDREIKSALKAYMRTETASEEWCAKEAKEIIQKIDEIAERIEKGSIK